MKKLKLSIILAFIMSSCTKQGVTKIVPMNNSVTPSGTKQNQVEGTINGGGGKGVRCNKAGKTSVETLDLYEAKVLYGLQNNHKATTQVEALDLFTTLITRHLWNPSTIPMDEYKKTFREQITKNFLNKMKYISSDKKLKVINDSFEPLIEENCELVQVAVYYDESILLVDQSLWDQMDWVNKIALLAHEIFYLLDRQNGSTNSMAARKLVGQLFSTKGARPRADGVPTNHTKYTTCDVSDKNISIGYLYAYDSEKEIYDQKTSGVEFVFNYLKNSSFLFRTSAFYREVTLDNLLNENFQDSLESPLYIESYDFNVQSLHLKFHGKGRGTLYIMDEKTGTLSKELEITCDPIKK